MKIIFIRHGDPDYVNDSLTEKGIREAKLLAERVCKWDVTDFYCSPLGRAQKTASYSLEKMGRNAVTYDWMREFSYMIDDPVDGRHGVPWDFLPEYWTEIPDMYDRDKWVKTDIYQSNPELEPAYREICDGIDKLLLKYGYQRYKNYYLVEKNTDHNGCYIGNNEVASCDNKANQKEDTIVIFCHLGVTCAMMSHILGISPVQLWQSFFLAPTSVTVLGSEERWNNTAFFRTQVMGDTTHLLAGNEPISKSGYFTDTFNG